MKPNWKQIIPALLVGCLIGGLIGARCQKAAFQKFWRHGPDTQKILNKFDRELSLDEGQKTAVKEIIERHREKTMALHKGTAAKFNDTRREMRAEIAKLLNPEQQKKFEAMVVRWESRHKHWNENQTSLKK